ncbi:MAG: tetratricopeptide repeat protein, partial [Candidatus Sumerlaeota bacterium]|nr:tetratricopeptide repeat protein [Candidatus Sumerlaeota bacterium]
PKPTPSPRKIEAKPTPPPMPSVQDVIKYVFTPEDKDNENPSLKEPLTKRPNPPLESPEFYKQSGKSFEDRGMLPEALQEYIEAKSLDPKDIDVQLKIVSLFLKMNREERASRELERLRAKFPQSPEVLLHSGNFHLSRKEYAQAAEYYKQAIKLAPDFSKAYNNLGVVYMNLNQYKLAAEAFEQTLAADPDNKSAHLNLGLIFDQHLPDPTRARYHYRRYLALGGERAEEVKQWLKDLPPAISNK